MNQQQFDGINPQQRPLIAVAYLMQHADERPENCKPLFSRLEQYDKQAEGISSEIKKAQKFIDESKTKIQQFIGAINATSEIIAGMLPESIAEVWCRAYEIPDGVNVPQGQPEAAASVVSEEIKEPVSTADMAGATAKALPPVDVNALSKGQ